MSINPGSTLSGSGLIVGNLLVAGESQTDFGDGGRVLPGSSPGTLSVSGDFVLERGANLVVEVAGTEPGRFDVLHVLGDATFEVGGRIELRFIDGFAPVAGEAFFFLDVETMTLAPELSSFSVSGLMPGFQFDTGFDALGRFGFLALNDGISTVPEPHSLLLLLSAAACCLRGRRRLEWRPPRPPR